MYKVVWVFALPSRLRNYTHFFSFLLFRPIHTYYLGLYIQYYLGLYIQYSLGLYMQYKQLRKCFIMSAVSYWPKCMEPRNSYVASPSIVQLSARWHTAKAGIKALEASKCNKSMTEQYSLPDIMWYPRQWASEPPASSYILLNILTTARTPLAAALDCVLWRVIRRENGLEVLLGVHSL